MNSTPFSWSWVLAGILLSSFVLYLVAHMVFMESKHRPRLQITLNDKQQGQPPRFSAILSSAPPEFKSPDRRRSYRRFGAQSHSVVIRDIRQDRFDPYDISAIPPADIALPVLFVIAHPDDECMFFGPTIQGISSEIKRWMQQRRQDFILTASNSSRPVYSDDGTEGDDEGTGERFIFQKQVRNFMTRPEDEMYLICLSNGNHDGLGTQRENELFHSCSQLGIHPDHVVIIDDPQLPDGPEHFWSKDHISRILSVYVRRWNIQTVITFDNYGVSGHPNHIAAYQGTQILLRSYGSTSAVPLVLYGYRLVSIPLWRKYLAFGDIVFILLSQLLTSLRGRFSRTSASTRRSRRRSKRRASNSKSQGTSSAISTSALHQKQADKRKSRSRSLSPSARLDTLATSIVTSPVDVTPAYQGRLHLQHRDLIMVASPQQFLQDFMAMQQHRTQLVWFRWLYVFFSRYMYINSLERIEQA